MFLKEISNHYEIIKNFLLFCKLCGGFLPYDIIRIQDNYYFKLNTYKVWLYILLYSIIIIISSALFIIHIKLTHYQFEMFQLVGTLEYLFPSFNLMLNLIVFLLNFNKILNVHNAIIEIDKILCQFKFNINQTKLKKYLSVILILSYLLKYTGYINFLYIPTKKLYITMLFLHLNEVLLATINVFGFQMLIICIYFRIRMINEHLKQSLKLMKTNKIHLEIVCQTINKLRTCLFKVNDYYKIIILMTFTTNVLNILNVTQIKESIDTGNIKSFGYFSSLIIMRIFYLLIIIFNCESAKYEADKTISILADSLINYPQLDIELGKKVCFFNV